VSLLGTLYLAALIFGLGINLLQFVLAGIGGDADADHGDLDAGGDVDADADVGDGDVVHPTGDGAHHSGDGGFLPLVLSLRFWTFGSLAFGIVGSLIHFAGLAPAPVGLALAVAMGLASGLLASWVFRALTRSSSQSGALATDAVGQVGRVLVPVARGARGKIRIQLRGQTIDYLATTDDEALDVGADVLVSEVRSGEVHVCRAPSEFAGPPSDDGA
jgi:membrane protein implicated in regulation of membrane protease activity